MAVFGIVSEFNPFHRGHEYLVTEAKRLGATAVVSVMSGNATQRGELAICDKYLRAEAAARCGVDLLLELPYPFSASSAESFAAGAISVLSHFCDTVIFGSECGDIDLLHRAADYAASEEFKLNYRERLLAGEKSAEAYIELIRSKIDAGLSSNDILGVEYIKASQRGGYGLSFVTVRRTGSGYRSDMATLDGTPDSAMAIRKMLREGRVSELCERLPEASFSVLSGAVERGEIADTQKYLEAARLFFRMSDKGALGNVPCLEGGIAERICRAAHESATGEELISLISTKRYTDAKLRRGMLFALTGVKASDLAAEPAYTNLLAANGVGRELLSENKKQGGIRVITKPADVCAFTDEGAVRQRELSEALDTVYTYCMERSVSSGALMKKKPYIT